MALTLAQAAAMSTDQVAAGVMRTLVPASFVLDRLNFETIDGNAYKYYKDATLPGAEFRAVNAAYAESTGTLGSATESLVILGGDADVDRFLQLTRSNVFDQLGTQVEMKTRAVAHKFNDSFINGDTAVDANSFDGLKKRLTGSQLVSSGTNGAAINTNSDTRQTFFDALDALIALVPNVDAFITNAGVLAKFRSAARRETLNQTTVDTIGRTVDTYNGVPFLDIGNKADGTPIIPQTEVQGSSSVAASIYAVHFGAGAPDQGVVGLTNGGVQVMDLGQLETKPVYRVRIEWFTGLALFGPKPAARLSGVLAA
ncbi:MAG: phage major capsid protein [Chloroflexi bacterium]|nr:phage major capsid protein [Chloroflexota bacterium]